MKRSIITALLVFTLVFLHSCSLFKTRTVNKKLDQVEYNSNTAVKKEFKDSALLEKSGLSETTSKVLSEEITYRKGSNELAPIELSATFRLDTSSSLKGDTAIKLVDVNNNGVSVSIFQNKKTNELMAKVSTGRGVSRTVPFEELQIKRNYQENTSKVDTGSKKLEVKSGKVDSNSTVGYEHINSSKDIISTIKPLTIIFIAIGLIILIVGGVWSYRKFILKK